MKPMLKTAFISLVTDLLAAGHTPELQASPLTCWGNIRWTDADGKQQVRQLYSSHDCSARTARTSRARFTAWFDAATTAFNAAEIEKAGVKVGVKVFDKATYETRVVTAIRAGVLVLDDKAERILGDVVVQQAETSISKAQVCEEVQAMTPTQAVKHMVHTLAGVIEQSKKPDFDPEQAYSDIRDNYGRVKAECDDLAITTWLKHWICFWADSEEVSFAELNQEKLNRLEHILATGWLPSSESGAEIQMSTLFELDWWAVDDVCVTRTEGDKTFGTATVTDVDGLYQAAFEWVADEGELARSVDLPVIISITSGRFTLPYNLTLTDCTPLEALEEMDAVLGFSADIYNEIFSSQEPR